MKNKLRFLVLTIMTLSWIAVSAQEYHIQEGFSGSTPEGWTTTNTYNGSSDNNGVLEGEKACKMKATYSEVVLPSVVGAGVLTYFIKPNNTFSDGKLYVEKSVDNGENWVNLQVISADSSILVYTEQTINVDVSESVIIRFVAEGGTGTSTLFMLDDVQLTKLTAAEDDAQLASLTMNGESVPGFSASILDYEMTISFTSAIPQFDGVANNADATVTPTQLSDLQGDEAARTAKVKVLAADGTTTQTYTVVVTVSSTHIETGFGDATSSSMGALYTGWSEDMIYITSSVKGPGNKGVYDGTAALKFMNKKDGDAPFIKSPDYEKVKTLSFWLFVEDPRAGSPCKLKIETITKGVTTELATINESELAADAWTEFTYDLNIADSTSLLFSADITGDWEGDMSTATRIWMDDLKITADPELGSSAIRSTVSNTALETYPNPVTGSFNIKLSNETVRELSLFNATGRKMYTSTSQLHSVDMSHLNDGVYLLQVKTDSGVMTRKILKK